MSAWKQFSVWLVICLVCAALTIAAVLLLDGPLGLQHAVSRLKL